jgi:hypothetical protein
MSTEIAGDIVAAGTALGGLLLVFIGVVTTAFQSYDSEAKAAVKGAFQRRGILGLVGFLLSLAAAACALAGKSTGSPCLVAISVALLGVTFLTISAAAIWTVLDIK